MNKQRYIALLKNPSELTKEDIPDITELIDQFPYCQNAHILLAKIQTEVGSMHAAKLARKAALYTSDRAKLKNLLQPQEQATNNQIEAQATSKLILQEQVAYIARIQEQEEQHEIIEDVDIQHKPISDFILPTKEIVFSPIQEEKTETEAVLNIKYEADKKANDFLKELEENLLALKKSKARAAGLLAPISNIQSIEKQSSISTNEAILSNETDIEIRATTIVEPTHLDPIDVVVSDYTISFQEDSKLPSSVIEVTSMPFDTDVDAVKQDLIPLKDETPKKSYAGLIESEVPTRDRTKSNDVLDLILSFDNRVKDYFDINEYASKQIDTPKEVDRVEDSIPNPSVENLTEIPFNIPFTTSDWKLAESRLEEQGEANKDSLLLNYLAYLQERKNKIVKPDKKREKSIISRFIQKDPIISPLSYTEASKDEDDDSSSESAQSQSKPTFVSETFAKLLEKQGKIQKAIRIYEELILRNPEKNSYFATRIQELKNKI